jgi:hypothetical protein
LTFSVLPPHRLPCRPIRAERLQGDFDRRAGIQTQGLDPPPRAVEAGCLHRAWSALTARVKTLQEAFGQLVSSTVAEVAPFGLACASHLTPCPRCSVFFLNTTRFRSCATTAACDRRSKFFVAPQGVSHPTKPCF